MYVLSGEAALLLAPWPGRSKVISRYCAVRVGEVSMCRKILDEELLPWRSRTAGEVFLRPVSVMLIMPWGVSSVKSGMLGGSYRAARGLQYLCCDEQTVG